MTLYGGVEAGGTKFVCAVGTGPNDLRAMATIPTTSPTATIAAVADFFRRQAQAVRAIGIGSFGPVDPNPARNTYGLITSTPKPGWGYTDLRGRLQELVGLPVAFETDVNAAAIGEHRWGAAQGLKNFLYLTVGTGIGGGAMVDGRLLHGLIHPEMGHIRIPRDPQRDPFPGCCPFHGDCLEGLASGPAIAQRTGLRAEELPLDHPVWDLEADYLALGLSNLICTLSPERVILGGGVMEQGHLFPLVRTKVQALLNGYVDSPALREGIAGYIVGAGLGARSGVLGAIALAQGAGAY